MLLEEFLVAEQSAGALTLALSPAKVPQVLLHGHCHQKAFGVMPTVEATLRLVPGLAVETVETSCCGMAGAFGYAAETYDISMSMGELSLLPAVRAAAAEAIVVADGTSCRQQIRDGTGRRALHVAQVLDMALC
jgi:Fe-S oxidoreductase